MLLSGCNGVTYNGTGADWDGKSTSDSQVGMVAAYESHKGLRAEVIDIDSGMEADEAGRRHKSRWNGPKHTYIDTCEGDDSILRFSDHIKEVLIVDIDGNAHPLTPGVVIPLGNGQTITGTDGTCPP
jgi:hypothetical protein